MYLGLRVLTASLWAAATALLIAGNFAIDDNVALDLYMWCIFLSSLAAVVTLWVVVDHLLTCESERNARITADAVGVVLNQLESEGRIRAVPAPTRRGT